MAINQKEKKRPVIPRNYVFQHVIIFASCLVLLLILLHIYLLSIFLGLYLLSIYLAVLFIDTDTLCAGKWIAKRGGEERGELRLGGIHTREVNRLRLVAVSVPLYKLKKGG
jgi:hypothetical protein